jgi:hypothetical protein
MDMNKIELLNSWFKEHIGGSLFLPDGWYGRPYDNIHRLSDAHYENDKLVVTLDDNLLFNFSGLEEAVPSSKGFTFGPFKSALFFEKDRTGKWIKTKEYSDGIIRILLAPG